MSPWGNWIHFMQVSNFLEIPRELSLHVQSVPGSLSLAYTQEPGSEATCCISYTETTKEIGTAILRERQSCIRCIPWLRQVSDLIMQWSGPSPGLNPNAHSPQSLPGVGPPVSFPLSHEFGCSLDTPPAPAPQTTGTRLLYPTLTPLMGEWKEDKKYITSLNPRYITNFQYFTLHIIRLVPENFHNKQHCIKWIFCIII